MIIEVNNINYTYGNRKLLDDISFIIEEHQKIALIGRNGMGKSTLLNIITKRIDSDSGNVSVIGDKVISYMSQEIDIPFDITIEEYINKVLLENKKLDEIELRSILSKLGIIDTNRLINTLSGGTKRKIALGLTLAKNADLYILDEPTNHLDASIIEWLEKYLMKLNKSILMVTHDRYFLDRICNKIFELDKGKIYQYNGNFSKYLELKSERMDYLASVERKLNAFLRTEYEWIKRGPQARATKDKRRIENYNKLTSTVSTNDNQLVLESSKSRLGNKTIEFIDVSMEYDNLLFSNVSFNLNKDERIGLVGPNGKGKSTFLNLINQSVNPTKGEVIIGETIRIGYFKQENIDLDYNETLIDYIKDIASVIETSKGTISALAMLERFLFDDPYTLIGKLSGGEKRRLYLCGILMTNPNVLLFDEPTNDLDIITLEVLEDYLEQFEGIVIVASHDRYFLDKIVNKVFYINDGSLKMYLGNYSDNLDNFKSNSEKENDKNQKKYEKPKTVKLTYKEQIEYSKILDEIDILEKQIEELDKKISIYYANYNECKKYYDEKEAKEAELLEKMERWEYLNKIYEESKK